jgi:dihydroorotase
MSSLLIQGGRVIDPKRRLDRIMDVYVEGDRIKALGEQLKVTAEQVVDARGLVVAPGFIDLHAHLREPGREDAETIASGTRAAAAGGFTTVCAMPNTSPVIDSQTGIKYVLTRAQTDGVVNVLPIAAITRGSLGEEITEFGDLITHGAAGFSDDGHSVMNAEIMRRALEYTSIFDCPIMDHCEDTNLSGEGLPEQAGLMNEGYISTVVGLRGIPSSAESTIVARDIDLARFTGGRLHICHVSTKQSVRLIREAKAEARRATWRVTAEVTPHHLTLTEEIVRTSEYDTNTKVKPPLGSEDDRKALIAGLRDGTLDAIATDHAPHTDMEKDKVYSEAPFGVIGFETAFAVLMTDLVAKRAITLRALIEKMTVAPARILGLRDRGSLARGAIADITIIDPKKEWTIAAEQFFSKSKNSPFVGERVRGSIEATIVSGRLTYYRGEILR